MKIKIHKILQGSRANGPGIRNAVWFQGCTLDCPGCFNPAAHDMNAGKAMTAEQVCRLLLAPSAPCDGITISGGEPFQQAQGLLELLKLLRKKASLSILVFSGYTESFLSRDRNCAECLPYIDALLCGPYRQDLPPAYERFCSSENQKLILLSDRFTENDFSNLPLSEVIIDTQGLAVLSGIHF